MPVETSSSELPVASAAQVAAEDVQHEIHQAHLRGLNQAWRDLQEFYLSRAKIVLCTASTASRKTLRWFKPTFVVVEEASQLTESACLNAIIRYYPSLKKIVLGGDIAQLPPTVISVGRNECYDSEKLSLFERLINSGVPHTRLRVQRRMHPEIAHFVSTQFYGGTLINHPSCSGRPPATSFSNFMVKRYGCAEGTSFFVSVRGSSLYSLKTSQSLLNPGYVSEIAHLVLELVKIGCPQDKILILSFYDLERKALTDLLHGVYKYKQIEIKSVDAAQGSEKTIVLLSTTRLSSASGLGFTTDLRPQCVALSRAMDGFVVVGNEHMGVVSVSNPSAGIESWARLVQNHRDFNRLIHVQSNDGLTRKYLSIPNDRDYVLASGS